ncbi:zinc-binding dehydrogenase [Streptomyces sp. NBC_01362]|nr:zinc-binding dehydrogenase [Streptomyces sp. NBC_01362]
MKLPVAADSALLPSLPALSDVMTTGHHGAVTAGVGRGDAVLVVGDGAVGLCAVIAAKRLGAERIVLAGRHEARTDLGRHFGATDVVAARGEEGIARIREPTGGVDKVIEAVGTRQALDTALGAVLDGGTISRLGVPQYEQGPIGPAEFMRNITLTGGACPARAYIEQLLPDVLDGTIAPGRVFDREFPLDRTPDAYRAMADRQVLKALVRP